MADQPPKVHFIFILLLLLVPALLLVGAVLFPFYFETTTLWYKFGTDRVYVQTGQVAGTLAFSLLLLQIVLAVRGTLLERVFGAANLIRYHRYNGIIILLLATAHIFFILIPEGLDNLPIGKKYWPEGIGAAAFILLFLTVITSQFRAQLKLGYKLWQRVHRPVGFFLIAAVVLHLYFVSDVFEQTVPRIILAILVGGVAVWVVAVKWFSQRS